MSRRTHARRAMTFDAEDGYDSDGCRECVSGGADVRVARARRAWACAVGDAKTCFGANGIVQWTQTTTTVEMIIALPRETTMKDINIELTDSHFKLWTSWTGCVETLSGTLSRRVKSSESTWTFERHSGELHVILAKDNDDAVFQSIFERGQGAKSHVEILSDFVHADEPYEDSDDLSIECKTLLEELKLRHASVVRGHTSIDDDHDFKFTVCFNENV